MNQGSQDIITISLDAMGGDNAPVSEVAGSIDTIKETGSINIILVGQQDKIEVEPSSKVITTSGASLGSYEIGIRVRGLVGRRTSESSRHPRIDRLRRSS